MISSDPDGGGLLWAILREDWRCQDTLLERAVVITYRLRHWGLKRSPKWAWRPLELALRPLELALRTVFSGQISARASIGRRFSLAHAWCIGIGPTVVIEDDVRMFHHVVLGLNEMRNRYLGPHVESHVYLGVGAKVLGPVRIGQGSVVSANSLVVKDVPAAHVAIGVPATCKPMRKGRGPEDVDASDAPPLPPARPLDKTLPPLPGTLGMASERHASRV